MQPLTRYGAKKKVEAGSQGGWGCVCVCVCVCVCQLLSPVQLFVTSWTVAHQSPLSIEFSRQEYWSGLPFHSPRDLPNSGFKPRSLTLQVDSIPVRAQKQKKVTLHLTPVPRLMMWRGRNSQKNGPHSPQRQASSSKKNVYCSLCQGEVVVEKVIHFYTSLLLKRNYPKENFLLLRWGIGLIQVGECYLVGEGP